MTQAAVIRCVLKLVGMNGKQQSSLQPGGGAAEHTLPCGLTHLELQLPTRQVGALFEVKMIMSHLWLFYQLLLCTAAKHFVYSQQLRGSRSCNDQIRCVRKVTETGWIDQEEWPKKKKKREREKTVNKFQELINCANVCNLFMLLECKIMKERWRGESTAI